MDGYIIKLVRDKIPEVIGAGRFFYKKVKPQERGSLLRKKLGEEVVEYLESRTVDELVDVLEAVRGLCEQQHDMKLTDLEARANIKFREKGGFRSGIAMMGISDKDQEAAEIVDQQQQ